MAQCFGVTGAFYPRVRVLNSGMNLTACMSALQRHLHMKRSCLSLCTCGELVFEQERHSSVPQDHSFLKCDCPNDALATSASGSIVYKVTTSAHAHLSITFQNKYPHRNIHPNSLLSFQQVWNSLLVISPRDFRIRPPNRKHKPANSEASKDTSNLPFLSRMHLSSNTFLGTACIMLFFPLRIFATDGSVLDYDDGVFDSPEATQYFLERGLKHFNSRQLRKLEQQRNCLFNQHGFYRIRYNPKKGVLYGLWDADGALRCFVAAQSQFELISEYLKKPVTSGANAPPGPANATPGLDAPLHPNAPPNPNAPPHPNAPIDPNELTGNQVRLSSPDPEYYRYWHGALKEVCEATGKKQLETTKYKRKIYGIEHDI